MFIFTPADDETMRRIERLVAERAERPADEDRLKPRHPRKLLSGYTSHTRCEAQCRLELPFSSMDAERNSVTFCAVAELS